MNEIKFTDISYFLNGQTYLERFDSRLKLICFINMIEAIHNINIDDFEIFYMNSKLGLKFYKYPIKSIVRIDPSPLFYIYKIEQYLNTLNYNYTSEIRNRFSNKNNNSQILKLDTSVRLNTSQSKITKDPKIQIKDNKEKGNKDKDSNTKKEILNSKDKSKETSQNNFNKDKSNNYSIATLESSINLGLKFNRPINEVISIRVEDLPKAELDKIVKQKYIQKAKDKYDIFFSNIKEALSTFSILDKLKKEKFQQIIVKLNIQNPDYNSNGFSKKSYEQTDFYLNLKQVLKDNFSKHSSLNQLPSHLKNKSLKPKIRRRDSNNSSNDYNNVKNDASFVSGNVSILKSKGNFLLENFLEHHL